MEPTEVVRCGFQYRDVGVKPTKKRGPKAPWITLQMEEEKLLKTEELLQRRFDRALACRRLD